VLAERSNESNRRTMNKIGISQRVEVIEEYEERRDCLDQRWGPLLRSLGYVPIPLFNQVDEVDDYVDTLDLDGILLTGGNDLETLEDGSNVAPERDSFERRLLDHAIERDLPVLGICRGAQLVNVYFGGSLSPVEGHVATTHEISITTSSIPDTPQSATTNSYHNYGITADDLATKMKAIARTEDATIEWVEHETHHITAIMWHPERDSPSERLDRRIIQDTLGNTKQ